MSDPLPEPGSMWAWPTGDRTFIVIASPGAISCTDENVDVLWDDGVFGFVVSYWFDYDCALKQKTEMGATSKGTCCRRLA